MLQLHLLLSAGAKNLLFARKNSAFHSCQFPCVGQIKDLNLNVSTEPSEAIKL